jgi:ribosomal protein L39E
MTFGHDGESRLTEWIAANARVTWAITSSPWVAEKHLIGKIALPLNLDQNRHIPVHARLSAARAAQRLEARRQPVSS